MWVRVKCGCWNANGCEVWAVGMSVNMKQNIAGQKTPAKKQLQLFEAFQLDFP